mgnify:CR=1 FL=1
MFSFFRACVALAQPLHHCVGLLPSLQALQYNVCQQMKAKCFKDMCLKTKARAGRINKHAHIEYMCPCAMLFENTYTSKISDKEIHGKKCFKYASSKKQLGFLYFCFCWSGQVPVPNLFCAPTLLKTACIVPFILHKPINLFYLIGRLFHLQVVILWHQVSP